MAYELLEFHLKAKSKKQPGEICIGLVTEERFTTYSQTLGFKTARRTGLLYSCLSWSGHDVARFGLMYVKEDEYLEKINEAAAHPLIDEPEMTVGTYFPS